MVDQGQVGGALSGAFQGAATGFQLSGGNPFATAGFAIFGALGGGLASGGDRGSFRANRASEFFRNQSLKLQASQITRGGGRIGSTISAQAAGGNVAGASVAAAQLRALIDVARQNTATIAGVSRTFQTGNAPTPLDEIQPLSTTAKINSNAAKSLTYIPGQPVANRPNGRPIGA